MGTSRTFLWKESWNKLNMLNGNLGNLWTLCTWIQWIMNMIWVWTAADLWRHHFIQGTSRSQRSWRRIHIFVEDFSNVSWKPRIFPLELFWNFWIGAAAQSMWNWSLVIGKSRISGGLKWASNDSETGEAGQNSPANLAVGLAILIYLEHFWVFFQKISWKHLVWHLAVTSCIARRRHRTMSIRASFWRGRRPWTCTGSGSPVLSGVESALASNLWRAFWLLYKLNISNVETCGNDKAWPMVTKSGGSYTDFGWFRILWILGHGRDRWITAKRNKGHHIHRR